MKPVLRYVEEVKTGSFRVQYFEITVPMRILLWREFNYLFDNWSAWLKGLVR